MHSYLRSKLPLKLLLIGIIAVAVNFGIVLGLQLLINFRAPGPVDEAALAKLDSAYEGCTILDHTENTHVSRDDLHIYLVKAADGTEHLVTLRRHMLMDRYRIVKSACKPLPEGEKTIQLRAGTTTFGIDVFFNTVSGHNDISWGGFFSGQSATTRFRNNMFLCIAGLCAAELAVWCLVFRKEEIA